MVPLRNDAVQGFRKLKVEDRPIIWLGSTNWWRQSDQTTSNDIPSVANAFKFCTKDQFKTALRFEIFREIFSSTSEEHKFQADHIFDM